MNTYELQPALDANVQVLARAIKQKLQRIIFIDGEQRSGKSNLAKAIAGKLAQYLETEFPRDASQIFFEVNKLNEFLATHKKKIVILDEAAFDLLSTDWQKKDHQLFLKMLYTAAKNNHTIFMLVPEISALSLKIVNNGHALFRTFINVNDRGYYRRGFFKAWNRHQLKQIYLIEKNRTGRRLPGASLLGRSPDVTTNDLVVEEKEYERRKDEAIATLYKQDPEKEKPDLWKIRFQRCRDRLVAKGVVSTSAFYTAAGLKLETARKELTKTLY
jgi:hypothetical protein